MAWKKKAAGTITIVSDYCASSDLAVKLAELRAEKWMVLHVFWDGLTPGQITIARLRSSAYAPKPAKSPKQAKPETE